MPYDLDPRLVPGSDVFAGYDTLRPMSRGFDWEGRGMDAARQASGMGGLLGGAGQGAALGTAIAPGIGTIIGGGLGLVGGLLGLGSKKKREKARKKEQQEWLRRQPKADSSRYDPRFQEQLEQFFAQYGLGGQNRINPHYNREYYTNPARDAYFAQEVQRRSGMSGAPLPSTYDNYTAPGGSDPRVALSAFVDRKRVR